MRRLILLSVVFFNVLLTFSQVYVDRKNGAVVGHLADGKPIKAERFDFNGEVVDLQEGALPGTLDLFVFRKNKRGRYKSKADFIRFFVKYPEKSFDLRYRYKKTAIYPFEEIILFAGNTSIVYNALNGERIALLRNFMPLYQKDRILVGLNLFNENILAYQSLTWHILWKRRFRIKSGIEDVFPLNDTLLLVYGPGVFTYNIYTGEGFDFRAKTAKPHYLKAVIITGLGVIVAVLSGGTMFFYNVGIDYTKPLGSPPLPDNRSNDLFFASAKFICRISERGKVIWKNDFPRKTVSFASLFESDSLVFIVNYGISYKKGKMVKFGMPFIAAYNKENGKQKFFLAVPEPVYDYDLISDKFLFLLAEKRVYIYDLIKGEQVKILDFNDENFGDLEFFTNENLYKFSGDSAICYDDNFVKLVTANKLVLIDTNRIYQVYDNNLYVLEAEYEDYKFVNNNEQIIILDKNNKKTGHLNYANKILITGDKIFLTDENSLYVIDIRQIVL